MKKINIFISKSLIKKVLDKSFRYSIKIVLSAIVILFIILATGVGYTWYMGQNSVIIESDVPDSTTNLIEINPTQPAENVPVSAAVQSLSSPVNPGSNASIYVKTKPGSMCGIVVEYNKITSADSGLVNKVADKYGVVDWSWTVDDSAPAGKWPVTVTCSKGDSSAVVVGDIVVEQ